MLHIIRAAIASGFCLLGCVASQAGPARPLEIEALRALPVVPVVVFGDHPRLTAEQFASENHLDAGDVKRRHAASGVIHCGNARGAGQLTLTDSVITTAAHVLYNEQGQLRGDSAHCFFTAAVGDQEVTTAIDMSSVISGNSNPYAKPAVHDWAVARLLRPVRGATPYGLAGAAQPAEDIQFVARGHSDWGDGRQMSMEKCRLHDALTSGSEGHPRILLRLRRGRRRLGRRLAQCGRRPAARRLRRLPVDIAGKRDAVLGAALQFRGDDRGRLPPRRRDRRRHARDRRALIVPPGVTPIGSRRAVALDRGFV